MVGSQESLQRILMVADGLEREGGILLAVCDRGFETGQIVLDFPPRGFASGERMQAYFKMPHAVRRNRSSLRGLIAGS
eukprot:1127205-Prymnesium_polylepis.2